ncbi:MAG: hypothetical protein ACOY82_10375 [Pseudomonadota bacterium]
MRFPAFLPLSPIAPLVAGLFVSAACIAAPRDDATAAAGTLHVCVDARGVKSYQDMPCAGSARSLGSRDFVRTAIDPALSARTRAIEAEMDRRNHGGGRTVAIRGAARKPVGPSPCEAAKARRKATLDKVGLKRTFDLLSRLDNEVWAACKGF